MSAVERQTGNPTRSSAIPGREELSKLLETMERAMARREQQLTDGYRTRIRQLHAVANKKKC